VAVDAGGGNDPRLAAEHKTVHCKTREVAVDFAHGARIADDTVRVGRVVPLHIRVARHGQVFFDGDGRQNTEEESGTSMHYFGQMRVAVARAQARVDDLFGGECGGRVQT